MWQWANVLTNLVSWKLCSIRKLLRWNKCLVHGLLSSKMSASKTNSHVLVPDSIWSLKTQFHCQHQIRFQNQLAKKWKKLSTHKQEMSFSFIWENSIILDMKGKQQVSSNKSNYLKIWNNMKMKKINMNLRSNISDIMKSWIQIMKTTLWYTTARSQPNTEAQDLVTISQTNKFSRKLRLRKILKDQIDSILSLLIRKSSNWWYIMKELPYTGDLRKHHLDNGSTMKVK